MREYLYLLSSVLHYGERREDRTGVGTRSLFGTQSRYDLRHGFPLVTTKKVPWKSVVRELLWFLSGSTNTRDLGCGIWDAWADEGGELGPIYGHQWRQWGQNSWTQNPGVDQIAEAIGLLKRDPYSRRNIVSAWNIADLPAMALPPCHVMHQLHVSAPDPDTGEQFLDMQMYQRSADLAVGVPFNIASYALLLSMYGQEAGYTPRHLVHTIGDAHIYMNHVDGVREQLRREPRPLPRLVLAKKPVLEMRLEDVEIVDYDPHPAIKFEVAV